MTQQSILSKKNFSQEITAEQLKKMQDSGEPLTLLDVRLDWEYKICHLEGSVNVPLTILAQSLTQVARDKLVVTICHHGVRSRRAANILRDAGFPNVTSLQGGVEAWAEKIDTSMERY